MSRHHYIPRCYLRQFRSTVSCSNNMIYELDKKSSKIKWLSTKCVMWKDNYYTEAVEAMLQNYETKFSSIVREINLSGEAVEINLENRAYLSIFISLLAMRGPRVRGTIRELHEWGAKMVLSSSARNGNLPKPPDVLGLSLAEITKHLSIDFDERISDHGMLQMAEASWRSVYNKYWIFSMAHEDECFITSDNPVLISNEVTGIVFNHPRSEILIPLRKDLMLFITSVPVDNNRIVRRNLIEMNNLNVFQFKCADRFVYAPEYSDLEKLLNQK